MLYACATNFDVMKNLKNFWVFECIYPKLTVCLVGERGEPGQSEPVPVAVWLEDGRVRLAPEWNILLRCGLDSSVKIWRTEPL